uniref:HhH-GPD domain-containing protein n=1 Tax=Ditylum brightwellii TaxID=49249 RepID=A0A7S4S475_9STRA|mmetsp:Transcript_58341/g.86760  ORF Transcript_58341/g.86760 Transcript_58341/m.86760 type:complete len:451 (-) Transcript_58341:833-2185(-)
MHRSYKQIYAYKNIDQSLKGWKCYLLPPQSNHWKKKIVDRKNEDEKTTILSEETRNQEDECYFSHLARVIFVAPDGKTFGSSSSVLRWLGIAEKKKRKRNHIIVSSFDFDLDPAIMSKRKRGNDVEFDSGNTLCNIGSQQTIIGDDILSGEDICVFSQDSKLPVVTPTQKDKTSVFFSIQAEPSFERKLFTLKTLQMGTITPLVEQCTCEYFAECCPQKRKMENEKYTAVSQCIGTQVASPFGLLEEIFTSDPWRLLLTTILLNKTSRSQVDPVLLAFFQLCPDAESAAKGDAEQISELITPLGLMHKRSRAIIRFSKEYLELIARKESLDLQIKEEHLISGEEFDRCANSDGIRYEVLSSATPLVTKSLETTKQCIHVKEEGFLRRQEFSFTTKDILGLFNCGQYSADAYQIFIQRRYNIPVNDYALKMYVDYQRGRSKLLSSMVNDLL